MDHGQPRPGDSAARLPSPAPVRGEAREDPPFRHKRACSQFVRLGRRVGGPGWETRGHSQERPRLAGQVGVGFQCRTIRPPFRVFPKQLDVRLETAEGAVVGIDKVSVSSIFGCVVYLLFL